MKFISLYPKKDFLKFLSLIIIVLGTSVGAILATQKEAVFDESQAFGGGGSKWGCKYPFQVNNSEICKNNKRYVCVFQSGRYYYVETRNSDCGQNWCVRDSSSCQTSCKQSAAKNGCDYDGDFRCSGTSRERCTNGVWDFYENCASSGRVCELDSSKQAACVVCHSGTASAYCSSETEVTQCFNGEWGTYDCLKFGDEYVCSGSPAVCDGNPRPPPY